MSLYTFPSPIILKVTGKDSERYLQARLTNNVKILNLSSMQRAAALTPQGKTQAFFTVLRKGIEEFFLISDGGDKEPVTAALKRFIVADRVTVEDLSSDYKLTHLNLSQDKLSSLNIQVPETGSFVSDKEYFIYHMPRLSKDGYDILYTTELSFFNKLNKLSCMQYAVSRIKNDFPVFPDELSEKSLFAEANLKDSVSYNKGCYVGQEVMEKIDSFASLPKILTKGKILNSCPITRGDKIYFSRLDEYGSVLTSAYDDEQNTTYVFISAPAEVTTEESFSYKDYVGQLF